MLNYIITANMRVNKNAVIIALINHRANPLVWVRGFEPPTS